MFMKCDTDVKVKVFKIRVGKSEMEVGVQDPNSHSGEERCLRTKGRRTNKFQTCVLDIQAQNSPWRETIQCSDQPGFQVLFIIFPLGARRVSNFGPPPTSVALEDIDVSIPPRLLLLLFLPLLLYSCSSGVFFCSPLTHSVSLLLSHCRHWLFVIIYTCALPFFGSFPRYLTLPLPLLQPFPCSFPRSARIN